MKQTDAQIVQQEQIATNIYSLWISEEEIAKEARPGQFLSLYSKDESRLLPRPISICEIDRENGMLRLVYRIAGAGTREFSRMRKGETILVAGPFGNGFTLTGSHILLIGGGIGIPPLLELAKQSKAIQKQAILGYQSERFLQKEFSSYTEIQITTEDGSFGIKGNVMDALQKTSQKADMIFACGPMPMLRAIKEYAIENQIPAQVSLEERMGCGIGACLACVCKTNQGEGKHTGSHRRVCKDGPVFDVREVTLE